MKEALAPFGIPWRRLRSITSCEHARIEDVDVGMVEDHTSPPRPLSLRRLRDQIEKAGSSPEACKRSALSTMNDLKSQHAVESDGTRHVVCGQCDGTDALDHCSTTTRIDLRRTDHMLQFNPATVLLPPPLKIRPGQRHSLRALSRRIDRYRGHESSLTRATLAQPRAKLRVDVPTTCNGRRSSPLRTLWSGKRGDRIAADY